MERTDVLAAGRAMLAGNAERIAAMLRAQQHLDRPWCPGREAL